MDFGWDESFTCVRLLESWGNYRFLENTREKIHDHYWKFCENIIYTWKSEKTPHGLSDKDDMLAFLDVYIAQHS